MKKSSLIFFFFFRVLWAEVYSQSAVFKENDKWGIKENGLVVVKPVYDSVFNFSVSNKVCFVCHKTMIASPNKFIKALTKSFVCNYLHREKGRLTIKAEGNDTCSVFTLGKHTIRQFSDNSSFFIVNVKSKKYVVDKYFNQITFKGYHEILYTAEPDFIIAQLMDVANNVTWGLINLKEETIIPFQYSEIKINTYDSLIVACSAGVKAFGQDDVYDYLGKKIASYPRHVDMATKNFIIHKNFEPKEYYIIYNIEKKDEKVLNADEVKFYKSDEIQIRMKNDWYIYNMISGEKSRINNPRQ